MPSIDLFALLGVVFIIILLIVLFFTPTDKAKSRGKRLRRDRPGEQGKDWRAASLRLEKHVYALRREIENGRNQCRHLERDLLVQKEKVKLSQNKLSQERDWQKKDRVDQEKKGQGILDLKKELKRAEQNVVKEHGQCLKLERELKDTQAEFSKVQEGQRALEIQLARLRAEHEQKDQKMRELQAENKRLNKKHDEATFVAKTDYEKLEKQLKDTEREFADFKRRIQREMG